MTPCAAWNARNVGSEGGGGRSALRVRNPAKAATSASTASSSTSRLHGCARQHGFGIGSALHGDAREERDEVEPRRARRRPWPVGEAHAVRGEQQVVGAHVEVEQARTAGHLTPARLELDEIVEPAPPRRREPREVDRVVGERPPLPQRVAEHVLGGLGRDR